MSSTHYTTSQAAEHSIEIIINFYLMKLFTGIFLLNFFACSACTFGDLTMMSFAFGLTIFVAVMVIKNHSIFTLALPELMFRFRTIRSR